MTEKEQEKIQALKGRVVLRELIEGEVVHFKPLKERKTYESLFDGAKIKDNKQVAEFLYRINGGHVGIMRFNIHEQHGFNRYVNFNEAKEITPVHILDSRYSLIELKLRSQNL